MRNARWRSMQAALVAGSVALVMLGGMVQPASASTGSHFWVQTTGEPPAITGNPKLPCADINVWASNWPNADGDYLVTGEAPTGTGETVYASFWNYDTTTGGTQNVSVINVQSLVNSAASHGDVPDVKRGGYHFRLNFDGSANLRSFWVDCPPPPQYQTYVGYADTLRSDGNPTTPTPWQGSPNVIFVGCGYPDGDHCTKHQHQDFYDAGAVRIDNIGKTPFTVSDASVQIGECAFSPWAGLSVKVPAGSTLILTETGGAPPAGCVPDKASNNNFDTSENGGTSCSGSDITPQINFSLDGSPTTLFDFQQILNTGGSDGHDCQDGNEGHDWSQIGQDG